MTKQKTHAAATLLLCLLALLLAPCASLAQQSAKEDRVQKRAKDAYMAGLDWKLAQNYAQAERCFAEAVRLNTGYAEAWYELGYVQHWLDRNSLAIASLKQAIQQRSTRAYMAWYLLSHLYAQEGKLDLAIQAGDTAIASRELDELMMKDVTKRMADYRFAVVAMQRPVHFSPRNLGPEVNSAADDFAPCLNADGSTLYFCSDRPTGRPNEEPNQDFWYADRLGQAIGPNSPSWQLPANLGSPVNSAWNEGTASFSADGSTVYFTGCNRPDAVGGCDLYMARLDGDRWTDPVNLGPQVNSEYWESQPCISADGRTLFFISVRPDGPGKHDIYYSARLGTGWTPAQALGPAVNTVYDELFPFFHADDQTLYFSSNGHPGMGGLDLYKSTRLPQADSLLFGDTQNLGYPLNTPGDEMAITVGTSGQDGYLALNLQGGLGNDDLYYFRLDTTMMPRLASYVRGRITDAETRLPVAATVQFLNMENGLEVRAADANRTTGRYLLSLPLGRDYAAYVEAAGYLIYTQNLSLTASQPGQNFDLDIQLQPVRPGGTLVLQNVTFGYNSSTLAPGSTTELNRLAVFLANNPGMTVEIAGHTDNSGDSAYNLALSQRRAEAVRQYLLDKGTAPSRLLARGYGETQPVGTNATEEGRARNRRTEFRILKNGVKE